MSERSVEVEFGPERVQVPEGGCYDRFRMNPDLDEVARDPAAGNIKLRAMLPQPLEPLRTLPGRGLVALTFFSYLVADNDPYNEVSIAVVVRRPGACGPHTLELIDSMRRRSIFGHFLALPVTTEIARVRGVHGYQLPKWLTGIDVSIGEDVRASIAATAAPPT